MDQLMDKFSQFNAARNSTASISSRRSAFKPSKRNTTTLKEKTKKFEMKVNLHRLEVCPTETSIFKVQVWCPGAFRMVSKKYRVKQPEDFKQSEANDKRFQGQVEFQDDILEKKTSLILGRDG
jgi:hypothetical protein